MELHANFLDDPLFFLQEHVVHPSPIYAGLLLCLLWPVNVRWLVHELVQPTFHVSTFGGPCCTWARHKLCNWKKGSRVEQLYNKARSSHRKVVQVPTSWIRNQQIFLQTISQNIFHRTGKLRIQLCKLCILDCGSHRGIDYYLLFIDLHYGSRNDKLVRPEQ